MAGDPFDDNPDSHNPVDHNPDDHNQDRARISYLTGEDRDVSLEPFDQTELDALLATLADASTWDDPPSDLGDRIVQLIADEAATGRTVSGPTVARAAGIATVAGPAEPATPLSERRRHFAWVGPAVLGAAAATLIAVAVTRIGSDGGSSTSADGTIDLAGTELAPGVAGTAGIDALRSGVRIHLDLPGLPRRDGRDFYEAWLRSVDGKGLVPIGTFHDGSDVVLWAGVPIADFPIITVTRESVAGPKAPEQGSSGEVVAKGQLVP